MRDVPIAPGRSLLVASLLAFTLISNAGRGEEAPADDRTPRVFVWIRRASDAELRLARGVVPELRALARTGLSFSRIEASLDELIAATRGLRATLGERYHEPHAPPDATSAVAPAAVASAGSSTEGQVPTADGRGNSTEVQVPGADGNSESTPGSSGSHALEDLARRLARGKVGVPPETDPDDAEKEETTEDDGSDDEDTNEASNAGLERLRRRLEESDTGSPESGQNAKGLEKLRARLGGDRAPSQERAASPVEVPPLPGVSATRSPTPLLLPPGLTVRTTLETTSSQELTGFDRELASLRARVDADGGLDVLAIVLVPAHGPAAMLIAGGEFAPARLVRATVDARALVALLGHALQLPDSGIDESWLSAEGERTEAAR